MSKSDEQFYPTKYSLEDINKFESKTEEDIYDLVKDLPVISTGHIYTDEECTNQIPSIDHVFGGRFPVDANRDKLFGGLFIQIKSLIDNYRHVFCRTYPEVTINNFLGVNETYVYSRFIVAEGDYK